VALHPDKIIALSRIANGASPTAREPVPAETIENRAVNAARTRNETALPKEPGSIESLAYDLRDTHWANHLARLKKRAKAVETQPRKTPQAPQIVFQLPGGMTNGQ